MIVPDTKWNLDVSGAGRSKYKALAQAIREGIVSKQLAPGEKLPTVRDLAHQIGVTPGTVARAYAVMIEEGRLVAGVGRGTFVAGSANRGDLPSWAPVMLDPQPMTPEKAHLLSPKVPDMGQSEIIRQGLHMLATQMPTEDMLRYPTRLTDRAAREAFLRHCPRDIIGPATEDDVVCAHGGQSAIVMALQTILHGANPVIAVDEL